MKLEASSPRQFMDDSPSMASVLSARVFRKDGWHISAMQLRKALESARGAVEAEHALVTDAWGGDPISLFDKKDAERRGVISWAIGTHAFVERLVYVSHGYTHCSEVFEFAVDKALRQNRQILQGPVLELLAKLDKLAAYLHRWLAPLRVARKAVDDPDPNTEETFERGGVLVPGTSGKDVVMWDDEEEDFSEEWMTWADDAFRDPANIPDILGPKPEREIPEDPRSFPACLKLFFLRHSTRVLQALEFGIDLCDMLATASGIRRPGGIAMLHRQEQHQSLLGLVSKAWQDYQASGTEMSMEDLDLQIGYWKFRGLGAPMRMMCDFAGVNWENVTYEVKEKRPGHWVCHEWDKHEKPLLAKENPFAQLPYVVNNVTGEVVTQSNAAYLYLGRLLSLNGSTPREEMWNEQVLFYIYGMFMEICDLVYPFKQNKDMEAFQKSLQHHFKTVVPNHYEKLETWLHLVGSNYFVSDGSPCTADFNVWEVVDQNEQMASKHSFRSPLVSFPHLAAFHTTIARDPRLQTYFDSDNYKLPCNNKMAFFQ